MRRQSYFILNLNSVLNMNFSAKIIYNEKASSLHYEIQVMNDIRDDSNFTVITKVKLHIDSLSTRDHRRLKFGLQTLLQNLNNDPV